MPADLAWPALIAAVTGGARTGWNPAELITAAVTGLPDDLATDRLPEALVFRIAALTSPPPADLPEPLPADLQPPDDAHLSLPSGPGTGVPVGAVDGEPPADPDDDIPPTSGQRWLTPDPFTPATPRAGDEADYLLEQHYWATAAVGRDRLIEFNAQAVAFYADRYLASWAPGYLRHRLGCDLTGDPRFDPGYAPAGWTALVDHLCSLGATEEELLAAGLATRSNTGALIDRFRDRLTFPIRDTDGAVRGFTARRNPGADDGRAGPRYLNTPTTDLYRKGEHLLGLHEHRAGLAAGATPALVEGPLDAIALTLAGDGATVGLATLGTTLTDRQADLLRPHVHPDGPGILVATDNGPAGQRAAERMFWQLTARGENPRRLAVPAGYDPAQLLQHGSVAALRAAINGAGPLAHHLLDARITRARSSPEGLAEGVRGIAAIITAMPPAQRLAAIDRATRALQLPIGAVHSAVLTAMPRAADRRPSPRPLAAAVSRPPTADLPRAPGTGAPPVRTSTPTIPDR